MSSRAVDQPDRIVNTDLSLLVLLDIEVDMMLEGLERRLGTHFSHFQSQYYEKRDRTGRLEVRSACQLVIDTYSHLAQVEDLRLWFSGLRSPYIPPELF